MAKYINIPFATSGNKTAIPDTTTDGTVNYTDGFGADYARPLGTDPLAKTVDRETINQALYDYGTAIKQIQENGFFAWQSTKAGGYDIGAGVSYNGVNYTNTAAGNTAAPDVSGWTQIIDEKQITGSTPLKDLNADIWTGTSRDTLVASLRANVNISGGGVITWDSNGYFNSTNRFIVINNGRGAFFGIYGYFEIVIPTSGTIQGVGGAANVTATSVGVPVNGWQALYYILPIGSSNPSRASNFRIVSYTSDVVIPDNWVLIASQNNNTNTLSIVGGKYTLHQGESIDTTKYSSAFVPNADTVDGVQGALLGVGGAGYAWVDETANRAFGVTYTNTYGKPIALLLFTRAYNGAQVHIILNGTESVLHAEDDSNSSSQATTFIVPTGNTYSLTQKVNFDSSINSWLELK